MGPDEFHEKYPNAEEGGFKDNAYTNVMTAWLLHKTVETWEYVPEEVKDRLREKIDITDSEIEDWKAIVRGLAIPITDEGIIEQFEGWMDLKELDWSAYRRKYDNIRRMDRILKAEGDSPNKYKAIKQADVLQMFYLLSPGQVRHTLELMGYSVDDETRLLRRNYEYYVKRTSHGSTLSYVTHASIARYVRGRKTDTKRWFMEALKSDVFDTQGGTTLEGVHCGVMAGTVEILMKNFAGLNLFADRVMLNPSLPRGWSRLSFRIIHRSRLFDIRIDPNRVKISKTAVGDDGKGRTLIQVGATEHTIQEGETLEIEHSARVYKTSSNGNVE
jgi:trehalose/maltose hydrolase-like predicted phosphorylase